MTTWSPILPGIIKKTIALNKLAQVQNNNQMSSTVSHTTVTSGKASEMFTQLFAGQLEAMARQMANQFNIDPEAAVKMAAEHAASIDLSSVEKPKRRATGVRKPKAPVTAENRCMARVWSSGSGSDQCKCAHGDESEYCSRHAKQAAICEKACQVDEDGKKKGLFCGRIDEFIPGTTLAPFSSDGIIRIEWKSPGHLEAIAQGLENETCRKQSKSRKSKKKPTVVAVEMNEEELAAAITTGNETKTHESNVVDQAAFAAFGLGEDGDEDADENFQNGNEDEEASLDVEEWEHNGESYLVCRETLMIYNEDGEETGKWGEGGTVGAPVPEEE